jgi:hypothetical protein
MVPFELLIAIIDESIVHLPPDSYTSMRKVSGYAENIFIIPGVSIAEYSDTLLAVTEYFICPSADADDTENAKTDVSVIINFLMFILYIILPSLN